MRESALARATHVEDSPIKAAFETRLSLNAGELRERIEEAWRQCRAAVMTSDKAAVRQLHIDAKHADKAVNYDELRRHLNRHRSYFPSGAKIEPARISPIVLPVSPRTLEERLFKVMRGYWSMPYSKGYGRRLRFVVMDQYHEAVIGIIGLQSPNADLACRDQYLGLPKSNKLAVVNSTLDAYTIGASPTYAPLLGGKLVAGLLHSHVIRQEYWRLYGHRRTTQLNQRIPQPLLAITTASAFGRSSIYNRLSFQGRSLARPLGFTKGFGTLHLEGVYPDMVQWLKSSGRFVPPGFGHGPKVRWQNIMRTLMDLEIPRDRLEHGLRREVFMFELVNNIQSVCRQNAVPDVIPFDSNAWAEHWKDRWCLPRVQRFPNWFEFNAYGQLEDALVGTLS